MSLIELFRNYAKGNSGNSAAIVSVTPTSRATYSGNSGNSGNTENNKVWQKNERETTTAIKVYCYRVTDKPDSELTLITHGKPLAEVPRGLVEPVRG